jgi:small subunit ribosomal protein S1
MTLREKKAQIIVSQRALTEGDREERKAATLLNLETGQVLEGEVRRLANFGAFVDIGGVDGLLHVKDMAWKRVDHPSDVVAVGDIIQVKVLRFDSDSEKIALGTKQLSPDPWSDAETRYRVGAEVTGDVVGLTDFGAFIMLSDGIEGLVHISEMSWTEKVKSPKDLLTRGKAATAWVLRCDIERRRLGLTLKNPADNPWSRVRERHPVGEKLTTKVTSTVEFGLFVELGDGLEGLVHVSDFSWGPQSKTPEELYSVGDEIEVMILDIDEERGRANLGIKQLKEDLTTELLGKYEVGQVLTGAVTSIQSYGVFAELEPGLEGMIHLSALGSDVSDPNELVTMGQALSVTITAIDSEEGRISLSLTSDSEDSDAGAGDAAAVDAQTAEAAPEISADESAEAAPEESAEAAPEESAEAAPEESAEVAPETPADESAEAAPETSADESAEAAPEAAPESSADESAETAPEESAEAASEAAPESSADESGEAAPEESAEAAPESSADESAEAAPEESAEAASETSADESADESAEAAPEESAEAAPEESAEAAPEASGDESAEAAPEESAEAAPEASGDESAEAAPEVASAESVEASAAGAAETEDPKESV